VQGHSVRNSTSAAKTDRPSAKSGSDGADAPDSADVQDSSVGMTAVAAAAAVGMNGPALGYGRSKRNDPADPRTLAVGDVVAAVLAHAPLPGHGSRQ